MLGKNFNGYITEFNVFDSFLDQDTLAKWTSCNLKERGNVFAWNIQLLNLTAPEESILITIEALRTTDFCEAKINYTYNIFFDKNNPINQYEASTMCRKMNAKLTAPPVNFKEMMEITEVGSRRRSWNMWTSGKVRGNAEWGRDFYPENGVYEYYDDTTGEDIQPLRYNKDPFFILKTEKSRYTYIPEICLACGILSCESLKCGRNPDRSSALCKSKGTIWLQVSGLCQVSTVDRRYRMLTPKEIGKRNTFVGSVGWIMVYDEEEEVWKIRNKLHPDKTLTMKVNKRLPVGRFRWEIGNSTCNEGVTEIRTLQVSSCDPEQFTCDDGNCVPLAGRCDSVADCDDVSDEKNCKLVSLDANKYLKDKPPTPVESDKFPVNVTIDIMSVLDIQEVGSVLKLLFILDLTWFDNRLQFYNLKADESMNSLTQEDQQIIWTPTVLFANTEKQLTSLNDEKSFAIVRRLGDSIRSGTEYDEDIQIFEGSENTIRLSRAFDIEFICEYDMRWYPFDSQTCYMVVLMEGNSGKFVELVDDLIKYTGPKELTQYFVKNVNMRIRDFRHMSAVLVVSITLGRRLLGTILTIFLPTVLLNLIGHATNFFKAFFFEAVVTVNLTGKQCFF